MKIRLEIIMYKHGFEVDRKIYSLHYTFKNVVQIIKSYFDSFKTQNYTKLEINIKIGKHV